MEFRWCSTLLKQRIYERLYACERCYYVPKNKCMDCPDCPDLCANATTSAAKSECVTKYSHAYYKSAAMEFNIYCKPGWKDFRPAFAQYLGVLIGNIILGWVADQIGRRKTYLLSLFIGIPALALSGAFDNIAVFYFLRAVTGIGIAGTMVVGWAYFSELVSPHQRFKLRTFSNWANGRIMLTLVCLFAGEWRLSSYLSAAISCIKLCIVLFILPESHIWLRKKGRFVESEESRKRIAYLSGMEFEPMEPPEDKGETKQPEKSVSILDVFKEPTLRRNLLVLWVMWFVTGMTAYLTDLCGGDMTKNFWVGQFLSGILLSVVRVIIGFADGFLPWMGRRFVLLVSQGLAVGFFACVIAFLYMGAKGEWYYTAVYLAAFVFTSIVWEPCYLCASELMPTDVRATSTASCSIIGRVANIGASMLSGLKTIYEPGVHMISMVCGLSNILVAFIWLQETKNCSLDSAGKKPEDAKADAKEMETLLPKAENAADTGSVPKSDEKH
ncbi:transporter, major facilitator family protein [Necator americanus]|uniref:Transporter, major facilitator family protein n=1 Tax=Necator americanus TaxID=51031 RepID=W2SNG2_NECAM|nr:transporter, major facilitator family protein [Necator americanus]ETN71073.1 transporter, major facilitator family protein [Necator americanus]